MCPPSHHHHGHLRLCHKEIEEGYAALVEVSLWEERCMHMLWWTRRCGWNGDAKTGAASYLGPVQSPSVPAFAFLAPPLGVAVGVECPLSVRLLPHVMLAQLVPCWMLAQFVPLGLHPPWHSIGKVLQATGASPKPLPTTTLPQRGREVNEGEGTRGRECEEELVRCQLVWLGVALGYLPQLCLAPNDSCSYHCLWN
mmetsp:Transcript_80214/g.129959  ORF Transcript_80214/g.129959 Transcript_80214/m.129959 type:complete len:197 (+) Transcript_80214:663-1253(+)